MDRCETAGPEESFHEEPGERFLPALDKAERELRESVKEGGRLGGFIEAGIFLSRRWRAAREEKDIERS
jgi:hypothetical protein